MERPERIETVEHIEDLARRLWSDLLSPAASPSQGEAVQLMRFFKEVGFFHKYKPYGVKIATPFGYSVFDLHKGKGFSFQVHIEPKLEGFHILHTKPDAVVYISTLPEWEAFGAEWAKSLFDRSSTAPVDNLAVLRPSPGDVIDILETQTVHAVMGCILEEYAGCSVDAVERLFDPYTRSAIQLPRTHQSAARLLAHAHPRLPVRQMVRTDHGWMESPLQNGHAAIDAPGQLWGGRVWITDTPREIQHRDDHISVIVPISSPVVLAIEGEVEVINPGQYASVLPQFHANVQSLASNSAIALHQVALQLVQAEWSR